MELKIGSILGQLLFLICLNDMSAKGSCFHPVMFADDSTLMTTLNAVNNMTNTIENNFNNELEKFDKWLKVNKLSLNCNKSKAMVFHMPKSD